MFFKILEYYSENHKSKIELNYWKSIETLNVPLQGISFSLSAEMFFKLPRVCSF